MYKKLISLYRLAQQDGIDVDNFDLCNTESIATIDGNGKCSIAINPKKIADSKDETVKVAHELGHCELCAFYNTAAACDIREKHERQADYWAAKKLVPPEELRAALNDGIDEYWELAEKFDVTEEFMRKAVDIYRSVGELPTVFSRGRPQRYVDPESINRLSDFLCSFERWKEQRPFGPNYRYTLEQYSFLWDHRSSLSDPKKYLCLN